MNSLIIKMITIIKFINYCMKHKYPLKKTYEKIMKVNKEEEIGVRYLLDIDYFNTKDTFYLPYSYYQISFKLNSESARDLLNNKTTLYKRCPHLLGRECIVLGECTEEEKVEFIKRNKCFVGKRNYGSRARQFSVYNLEETSLSEILKQIEENRQVLLEGYVEQHEEMSKIYPYSVNTLRIHTVNNGKEIKSFFKPMLRIGCNMAVVDANSGKGSYRTIVNEDGYLETPIYMDERFEYKKATVHHNTKAVFEETKVPFAKEAIELAIEAASYFPEVPYIGWDIAIAKNGPVVIEGNSISGCFRVYQLLNYMYHGVGLRREMDEMFDFYLNARIDQRRKELVEHAKECLAKDTIYLWGGLGEVITEEVIQDRKEKYPSKYTEEYCDKLRKCIGNNVFGFDCSGLIKNYIMGGLSNYAYKPEYDLNSYMMLEKSRRSGVIDTLPEEPGTCLFMPGHVGIYIGNQEVIESTSNPKFGDGVVKTNLADREWTHWFICPGMEES